MTVPVVFDRNLYAARRARAEARGATSFLVERAAETLADRLAEVARRFCCALDLNSRKQAFARIAPYAERWVRSTQAPGGGAEVRADEEVLPFATGSFDLVTSVLSLHAVNDLPGVLAQVRRALRPEGLFVAALFGGETLRELRRAFAVGEAEVMGGASPRVAPFADVRDLGALLQRAGFARPVADLDRVSVRYRSFATLAADLRAMGETNALSGRKRGLLPAGVLKAAQDYYSLHESTDEGSRATFDILYLTGWNLPAAMT